MNLTQGIIHTNKPEVSNTVCAIYDENIKTVVIDPTYADLTKEIKLVLPFEPIFLLLVCQY